MSDRNSSEFVPTVEDCMRGTAPSAESVELPGYDEWDRQAHGEWPDDEFDAWVSNMEAADRELAAITAKADAEAQKLGREIAELAAENRKLSTAQAEVPAKEVVVCGLERSEGWIWRGFHTERRRPHR